LADLAVLRPVWHNFSDFVSYIPAISQRIFDGNKLESPVSRLRANRNSRIPTRWPKSLCVDASRVRRNAFPDGAASAQRPRKSALMPLLLVVVALTAVVASAADGFASQTSAAATANNMAAQREIVLRILTDARAHRLASVRFAVGSYVRTTNTSLTNIMIFDFGFRPQGESLVGENLTISSDDHFQRGELVDWQQIPGRTDSDRVSYLADRACRRLNYIVFPDDRSLPLLQSAYADQMADRYCGQLRDAVLQQGHWRVVGSPIFGSKHEIQIVYANDDLTAPKTATPR
jgi:hypothetical protein